MNALGEYFNVFMFQGSAAIVQIGSKYTQMPEHNIFR